jgi:hypothetical protein
MATGSQINIQYKNSIVSETEDMIIKYATTRSNFLSVTPEYPRAALKAKGPHKTIKKNAPVKTEINNFR